MERLVIVGYRPKPNKSHALKQLMKTHVPRLREQGLATDREPILLEASDGTIIEVFGWKSKEAIEQAHSNPVVQQMWGEYAEVCDYVPVGQLPELAQLFSEFAPGDG